MKKFKAITKNGVIETLKAVLSSKFYPFITAAVTLLCYYLGWDIVTIYFISISGILMLLLLDDVSPIISIFLFMSVIVSLKNTPSPKMGESDYYLRTENLAQIVVIASLFFLSGLYRLIKTIATKKFTITPVFWGLAVFSAAMLFNGLFSENYEPKNLLYGFIMAVFFLGVYCALKDNLKLDSAAFERIAFGFLAFSILLSIELIVAYFTTEGLFNENGTINRDVLMFGWGVYNTLGAFLVICIPAVVYLAGKYKFGFVLTFYSVILFAEAFLSCSRQAMVGAIVVYPVCIVLLLIKSKNRIPNICICAAAVAAAVVFMIVFREKVHEFFDTIFENLFVNNELNGSGRAKLWCEAFENYRSSPLLGVGFYVKFCGYDIKSGLEFIPYMCHNTILQILSSCGTVGLIAYAVHRVQTIISYSKNMTMERTLIALTITALLVISLFDNHLFNIFPTIIYSSLLAVLTSSEKAVTSEPETVSENNENEAVTSSEANE